MRWWRRGVGFEAVFKRARHGDCIEVWTVRASAGVQTAAAVRLARIRDPDDRRDAGNGDTSAARVLNSLLAGSVVTVIPRRSLPDPCGRIVADVKRDGFNVADELVRRGLVVQWHSTFTRDAAAKATGVSS